MSDLDLDRAPIAPAGSLGGIPLVDLSQPASAVVEAIGQACRDWGFFQIGGHRVPPDLSETILSAARRFFALPRDEKRLHSRTRDNPWGYYDRELTKEQRDKKEIFDIGPDQESVGDGPLSGATPWPESPVDFAPAMRRWAAEMERLSNELIGLIGTSLTGRADALISAFEPGHTSFLRLNHYPIDDELAAELGQPAGLGIHHHTDAGALTVLLQDGVSGLQVHRDGAWHDVTPVANAFTINIGDMVQVWSNDIYPAPVHRVLAMQQSDRISIPFFCNPSYAAVVAPLVGRPHYAPIPWAEFRRRRAEGDFADYGTEVQIKEWRIATD